MNQKESVQIPATMEEAITALGGIDQLLTAKGWERAAIVYAFTKLGEPGPVPRDRIKTGPISIKDFARLGINGLRSDVTVRFHRENWKRAIEQGEAVHIAPGDVVTLPTSDYPPARNGERFDDLIRTESPVEHKVTAIRRLLEENPEVRDQIDREFVQRAGRDPGMIEKIERVYEEHFPTPEPKPAIRDTSPLIIEHVGETIYTAVQARQVGIRNLARLIEMNSPLDRDARRIIDQQIAALEETRTLINQYETLLRSALGISVDETFQRLVGGKG